MSIHSLKALPKTSFVQFEIRKVSDCSLIWLHEELGLPRHWSEFAYCIETPEDGDFVWGARATALGERYGGCGLGSNGGGVRCGLVNELQIKGIGQNPLAGHSTDYWHKEGSAAIHDGIREAFWGELLSTILPIGAVRVHAILSTPLSFKFDLNGGTLNGHERRALILRTAALRPAHFMRAINFLPNPNFRSSESDFLRTAFSVSNLAQCCRELHEDLFEIQDSSFVVNETIRRCFVNLAKQLSATRYRRLMHGSLIASNVTLDGKFLDFGTMTALPSFERFIVAPGTTDLWTQEISIIAIIKDLHFSIRKHLSPALHIDLIPVQEIIELFKYELLTSSVNEVLTLVGLPEALVGNFSAELKCDFYNTILEIVRRGNSVRHYHGDSPCDFSVAYSRIDLSKLLRIAPQCRDKQSLLSFCHSSLRDPILAKRFIDCYSSLIDEFLPEKSSVNRKVFFILNAIRRNISMAGLYRDELNRSIDNVVRSNGSISVFIKRMLEKWTNSLRPATDSRIYLAGWFCAENYAFDINLGFLNLETLLPKVFDLSWNFTDEISNCETSLIFELSAVK